MIRNQNEPFEDYKKRRKAENEKTRLYLKGRIVWKSKEWGTYRISLNGKLE